MPLSLPGMALRVVRRRDCPLRVFQLLLWAAMPAGILNIVVCVIVLLPANWDVFKSLCFIGHTFDEKYGVEIDTPDKLRQAFCTYGTLEQQALAAGWMLFVLELLTVLALAQTLHLPRKLVAESWKDGTKNVSSRLSALGGPIAAFDSRGGRPESPDQDIESLRPLAPDDLGLGLSLWSGRSQARAYRAYREYHDCKGSGAEDALREVQGLSARSSDGRRRHRKQKKTEKAERVLEEGEVDSEDLELSQLFATVKNHRSPRNSRSSRSPRREARETASPRRIGRARELWDTAPAALQSWSSSNSIPPTTDPSLASCGSAEGMTRSLFHSMKSSAGLPAIPAHAQDVLEVAKSQAASDDVAEGDDVADGDFFAYALRVSQRFDRRQGSAKDPTAHLQESLLAELFHPALKAPLEVSRI